MRTFIYVCIILLIILFLTVIFLKIWDLAVKLDQKITNKAYSIKKNNQNTTNNKTTERVNYKSQHVGNKNTYQENTYYTSGNGGNHFERPKNAEPEIPDCLSILGFTKIPENKDDIKMRYKKLSKIYHPDMGGTEEEFQRLNKAWDSARKLYGLK